MTLRLGTAGSLRSTLFVLLLAGAVRAQSASSQRHDTQMWNDTQVAIAISKRVDFTLLGGLQLGGSVSHLINERIGFSFSFKARKYLTLAQSYLHLATQPLKEQKGFENRLTFAATLRAPIRGGFTLSDRNQFERRMRHPQIDATRYRNRLQIEHKLKIGSAKLTGFMADEVSYDWSANAWARNRFTIGVGKTFNEHFTGELYYLRQNDSHSTPGDLNVIGTSLRFRLK